MVNTFDSSPVSIAEGNTRARDRNGKPTATGRAARGARTCSGEPGAPASGAGPTPDVPWGYSIEKLTTHSVRVAPPMHLILNAFQRGAQRLAVAAFWAF